ncbi:hypothetical protein O6H91_Y245800 [Diphasiastrum complanatum]|nr:hypothetical protein O6H91_Y245800 [Diphasiastrum complanatum]
MATTLVAPMDIPIAPKSIFADALPLSEQDEEDLYNRLKTLQRQLEFVDIQEEYIKDEQKNLKRELLRAQEEVKRIQSVPLVIGQFMEMVDQNNGIVGSTTGSNYYVRILSTINRELLKPSSSVALHRHSNALVDVLPPEADSSISLLTQSEKPDVTYNVRRLFATATYLVRGCFIVFLVRFFKICHSAICCNISDQEKEHRCIRILDYEHLCYCSRICICHLRLSRILGFCNA